MPPPADFPAALAAHPLISQWIDFTRPGVACLRTGRVELGQGNMTALVKIAADELELRMDQVIVISGDTRAAGAIVSPVGWQWDAKKTSSRRSAASRPLSPPRKASS